jgi:hypothetical protein
MRIGTGTPVVFGNSDEPVQLQRMSHNDRAFTEGFIQDLVLRHPDILPVAELDEAKSPLVPIGREIATDVGPIDALFVSPSGGITIVEAKLWRNPESRREVVGQIIDYAQNLSNWSYERLDQTCLQSSGSSLWELVAAQDEDRSPEAEATFVDTVSKSLREGRFLLLIVGDGIREEVERMASYVQSSPQLQFHLALVELRIFESAAGDVRVAVPSVVARTAEVTRAVVTVDVAEQASVAVSVSVPKDDAPRSRQRLSEDEFLGQFPDSEYRSAVDELLQSAQRRGLVVNIGDTGASIRVPIEAASQPLTIAWLNPPEIVGWMGLSDLTLGFDSASTSNRLGEVPAVLIDYVDRARALPGGMVVSKTHLEGYQLPPATIIGELERVIQLLVDAAEDLNAGRGSSGRTR